jgi:hypothetical protein
MSSGGIADASISDCCSTAFGVLLMRFIAGAGTCAAVRAFAQIV